MYPSVSTTPDGLQPPPISSPTVTGVKSSTTNSHNHHGSTLESVANGRTTNTGEPKPSSSSSPPKSQDFPSVSFSNHTPTNGNSVSTQPKSHDSRNGENPNHSGGSGSGGGGGDVFLQWGQKKRSKRTVGDKFSGGRTMPPPPPPPGVGGRCGGGKVRTNNSNGVFSSSSKDASSTLRNRMGSNSGGGSGGGSPPFKNNQEGGNRPITSRSTVGKRSEKTDSKKPPSSSIFGGSIKKDKVTDLLVHQSDHHLTSPVRGGTAPAPEAEVVEWPRIYIALSRKEKEDDYFSMKGTKLPHRPKKRAKAIDRTLQYCFPGMWLSDLSRARYEVRERKSAKKLKRRGLKGLDCIESDSE